MNNITLSGRGVRLSGKRVSPKSFKPVITLRIVNDDDPKKPMYMDVDIWGEESVNGIMARDIRGRKVVVEGKLVMSNYSVERSGSKLNQSRVYVVAKKYRFDVDENTVYATEEQHQAIFERLLEMRKVDAKLTEGFYHESQQQDFTYADAEVLIERIETYLQSQPQVEISVAL